MCAAAQSVCVCVSMPVSSCLCIHTVLYVHVGLLTSLHVSEYPANEVGASQLAETCTYV